jgi:hypothetical protein
MYVPRSSQRHKYNSKACWRPLVSDNYSKLVTYLNDASSALLKTTMERAWRCEQIPSTFLALWDTLLSSCALLKLTISRKLLAQATGSWACPRVWTTTRAFVSKQCWWRLWARPNTRPDTHLMSAITWQTSSKRTLVLDSTSVIRCVLINYFGPTFYTFRRAVSDYKLWNLDDFSDVLFLECSHTSSRLFT